MKDNILDQAYDILIERLGDFDTRIHRDFKGTNPFGKEPVSMKEQLYNYETEGYETFKKIADEQGVEAALIWQNMMEKEKSKRGIENG